MNNKRRYPFNAPAFLIIGAQKSGTTALFSYLAQHPFVKVTDHKEIDFFTCDYLYNLGVDFYHSQFPQIVDERYITFDASPSYLRNPKAAPRIFDYNPHIKLIAILRNPAYRAFSAWNMYVKNFNKDADWFTKWMQRCYGNEYNPQFVIRRSAYSLFSFTYYIEEEIESINEGTFIEAPILSHGLYHEQITHYLRYFEKGNLCIISSRELLHYTVSTLRRIETFLSLIPNHWDDKNLKPVLTGEYEKEINADAKARLSDYYKTSTKKLFDDFNIIL